MIELATGKKTTAKEEHGYDRHKFAPGLDMVIDVKRSSVREDSRN